MIYSNSLKEKKKELDEITVNGVQINSDTWYSAYETGKNSSDKDIRKLLGLPVTKSLVYYKNANDPETLINVLRYRIIEFYEITEPWAKLEIETDENKIVRIHSDYFAEMQKPSFIKDIKEMEEKSL